MKILKDQPCEQCGTTRYRETPEGGMVCKYGHLLVGWRQEEADDYVWMGRSQKKAPVLKEAKHGIEVLKGVDREAARLRIVQYGLQLVVRSLVHDMHFPAEFEYVARELWLAYISACGIQLSHEFIEQYSDTPKHNHTNNHINHDLHLQSSSAPMEETLEDEFDLDVLDDDSALDETSSSSSSNSDNDMDQPRSRTNVKKKRRAYTTDWPNLRLEDIIVFCYLTCLWMKIPVLSNDIHRWCFNYQLPYLKIMDGLPDDFVKRLDTGMISMFTIIPPHSKVAFRIRSYKRAFAHHCKLRFPKANVPILIHRFLPHFYLPEQLYFGAARLYERLNKYYATSGYRRMPSDDIQAMACTVILVKLCYRLDDNALNPIFQDQDMPSLLPKDTWYTLVQDHLEKWRRVQKYESLRVNEAELPVVLEFLKDVGTLSAKRGRKIRNNALRQHMRRISKESKARKRNKDSIYMKPEPPTSTILANTESKQDTRAVGSKYVTYKRSYGDDVLHEEYVVIVTLAAYILGMDFWMFHRYLSLCETQIHVAIKQK
ncbi:hypothetical protein K492DRAFT_239447 [Lichtheimia hyalospora FSU 10163]|nr:hypothetical protein K492DRAFT_239447 [Lichtheimia hyalospora FSU 10163]